MTSSMSLAPTAAPTRGPSVLAILVARSSVPALRSCLHALADQTYETLGILAIDDAADDETHELLVRALGEARVIRNDEPLGYARSVSVALAQPVAAAADHVLLLHGDTVLDPDAVASLIEATTLPGAERVGIVGAKVVDLDQARELRDVGRSVDRFGHAMSPLQPGEIDQGQFDRVLDVLAVDGCAMLLDRDVWQRVGAYDERLGLDDVDLCWRARVAGWRVLMTPRARVQHGPAHDDGEEDLEHTERYRQDRDALATVLKVYSWPTLLWVLPLALALTVVRLLFLVIGRRLEEAWELLAAIGWNVTHLGGTLRRRRVAQRSRTVRDHALRRYTASAGLHLPRWFQTAERILEEQRELGEGDVDRPTSQRLRRRTASFVSIHPVLVASFVGAIVWAFAVRSLVSPAILVGGVLPVFPASPDGFFHELASGFRTTGLGGTAAASPGLAILGALSFASFGSTALAAKVIVIGGPIVASVLCYRAIRRRTGSPGASVVGATAYGVSALMTWAVSDGRIAELFLLAVLPALVERIDVAFAGDEPSDGRWRLAAGIAVTIAVGAVFVPATVLVVAVTAVVGAVLAPVRLRGLGLTLVALVGATILVFPFVPTVLGNGGLGLWSPVGQLDPWRLLRLSLGPAPGDWQPALVLPVAAILALALARGQRRAPATRAAILGAIALGLSWLSVAGYLPVWATNGPAYATLAGVCCAFVLGDGLASAFGGLERSTFGFRQIGGAVLAGVLILGVSMQTLAVMIGGWSIGGPEHVPASWSVLAAASPDVRNDPYNVVWISAVNGRPFPAPGGDPSGVAEEGDATVAYGLTDREGAMATDIGRPLTGPGQPALGAALDELLSGTTVHAGAVLAPFGVRYVLAPEADLPAAAVTSLGRQVDLEPVPSAGLLIWRNVAALPPAAVVRDDHDTRAIARSTDHDRIQRLDPTVMSSLVATGSGWSGTSGGGDMIVIATAADDAWRLDGTDRAPQQAFGWATSFDTAPAAVRVVFGDQFPRTVSMWLLAAAWAVALWVTRKPVRR
jgi:GT2 family glycosyltransferase